MKKLVEENQIAPDKGPGEVKSKINQIDSLISEANDSQASLGKLISKLKSWPDAQELPTSWKVLKTKLNHHQPNSNLKLKAIDQNIPDSANEGTLLKQEQDFSCDKCEYIAKQKGHLKRHKDEKHD